MSITDYLHYVTIGNPVSKAVIGASTSIFRRSATDAGAAATVKASSNAVVTVLPPLWKLAGHHYYFVRLAGLSGTLAVILGAIGSHRINSMPDKGEAKLIFETANRFHFYHALALMAVPLTKRPVLTGVLMITGKLLFCGILYHRAFTGDKRLARFAPYGGTCLILAWISLLF